MRYGVVAFVFCALVAGVFFTRPAGAVKPFMEQFKAIYVKPKAADRTAQIFKEAVDAKGCTICHRGQPAKPTKGYNAYGAQVKKLLTKRDAQNPQAIRAALKKVSTLKSNPDDPKSPTFAQRLRDGKLPVGEIHVRSTDGAKQGG
jgi:hypothetical protein